MCARIIFLAAAAQDVGLTSLSLGLVRALQRDGMKVAFVKPIAQPRSESRVQKKGIDTSSHFARTLCMTNSPEPIPFEKAEEQIRKGDLAALLEDVATMTEALRADHDVVVVEGLIPLASAQIALRLNVEIVRSLGADVIPVLSGVDYEPKFIAETVALIHRQYAREGNSPLLGLMINKMKVAADREKLKDALAPFGLASSTILGAIPYEPNLNTPRLSDLVSSLDLSVVQGSKLDAVRVREIVVGARSVEKMIDRLRPETLVVMPGDRSDIALASALAHSRGVPLAGLLLTCGAPLATPVADLMASVGSNILPILSTPDDTYATASRLAHLSYHVSQDDSQHMEKVIDFVAEHIDTTSLRDRIGTSTEARLSPPRFRNHLIEGARRANKRIVLPEGEEPRTLQAAVICHQKGIARCVLLGRPDAIQMIARAKDIELPADLEILDPAAVRANYVDAMVELRKSKGMTPPQAMAQLEDTVVLGTMMLAVGEVDGLVSGAVHTTASTVRPALQLIKTEPGQSIVSSVFFMLMPDQVLVYGDCAINPNPTADQLAEIAVQSSDTAKAFGIDPRVAMISYSTGTSGTGGDVDKVREATELAKQRKPDLLIDGPIQYDAASVESVGRSKAPDSPVAGRANVFVFPDLNTGNTTYKAVQRSADVVSVGPMLQGLRKPVNDLSRGALVDDIVFTIALTAIQADQQSAGEAASEPARKDAVNA
ncbi:phosphate acetyltransferase [Aliirhizobium cellulosilyticum]|uniref:Phosphate acetyltransferase n=1 Tax=Aliirhizobium cellulosilyticum TaxID=393664 RepID=A0A7W6UZ72_9HYPH|nr:phosphate acetyltransferase [Rhizobium cellulosilyticum]MBB4346403.1 phosphate acetyltransferase [Rhizobium cellulosilyticum]MBB4411203.1 phosphate acetyltransferase [Rhizobium cellulosilyticum]MBB4445892.1 phosphate acetyltransferase [Rhizobium cellulosilyticum]